jgi:hypothetical protein
MKVMVTATTKKDKIPPAQSKGQSSPTPVSLATASESQMGSGS